MTTILLAVVLVGLAGVLLVQTAPPRRRRPASRLSGGEAAPTATTVPVKRTQDNDGEGGDGGDGGGGD